MRRMFGNWSAGSAKGWPSWSLARWILCASQEWVSISRSKPSVATGESGFKHGQVWHNCCHQGQLVDIKPGLFWWPLTVEYENVPGLGNVENSTDYCMQLRFGIILNDLREV